MPSQGCQKSKRLNFQKFQPNQAQALMLKHDPLEYAQYVRLMSHLDGWIKCCLHLLLDFWVVLPLVLFSSIVDCDHCRLENDLRIIGPWDRILNYRSSYSNTVFKTLWNSKLSIYSVALGLITILIESPIGLWSVWINKDQSMTM